jgi:fumarate reductase flavoprotein subunit
LNNSTDTFDLIVIGGGIAGLSAAVRSTELGLRPLLLEQGEGVDYPCNSRHSGGIVHIGFYDPFRPAEELEQIINQLTNGEAKPELAKALANNGARLITWLQEKGGKFMRFNPQEGYRWCMAPPRALRAGLDWKERGPDLMLRRLAEVLNERGGVLQQGARVSSLLMENGRCIGAQGTLQGNPHVWHAPYCVLADGGFQANRELYERYIGDGFDSVFQRGARTGRGDGLTMALQAGGTITPGKRFYGHVLCSDAQHNDAVWPYPEVDAIATAGMVIDNNGQRIVDEGRSGVHLANELAAKAKTAQLFAIFDQTIWDGPGTSARIPANPLLEKAGGTILRADTAHDLAEKMGVPASNFIHTINQYNQALTEDRLDTLDIPRSKKVKPMPIINAPLMAIPICPGITYTMVGINIDEHAQVLDKQTKPIPGLFAAGATTGGIEGGQDSVYIGGLIKSGSFGLIAAERIALLEGKTAPIHSETIHQKIKSNSNHPLQKNIPEQKTLGLEKFPILRATILYGKTTALVLSILIAILCYVSLPSSFGLLGVLIAIGVGVFVLVALLGVVELVILITEFLIPNS